MKRFLSTLLVICMLAALVPAASAEASTTVLDVLEVSGIPHEVVGKNTADMLAFDVPLGVTYNAEWEDADWNDYEGVLEMGGTYNLFIYLYPEEGYTFDLGAEVILDVDESMPYVDMVFTNVADTDYIFIEVTYQLTESMPDVEICGITSPVVGQIPTVEGLSVPAGVDYFIGSAQWYYWDENDEYVEVTEPFVGGGDYYLELEMALPVGYVLTDETSFILDAEAYGYSFDEYTITLEFYLPGEPIGELSVEGVPEDIQAGQQASLDGITIPEDAPYTLEASWQTVVDGDWATFEGTFQENGIYRLDLEFYPAEGYQMDVEEIYINGVLADYYGQSNSWLGMEILYPLTQEIAEVELLGVQEPQEGQRADTSGIKVPEGSNYSIEYAYWYDTDTYEEISGSFEKGKAYTLDVKLVPNEGYHFAQEATLTVNGQASDDCYGDMLYMNYWYEVSLKELIEKVDITGVVEPVIGEAPVTEGITAENCQFNVNWYDENNSEVTVFEEGKRYYLCVELYPAEGYRFSEDTIITIDGETPNDFSYVYDEYGYAQNTYSFKTLIEQVKVELGEVAVDKAVPTEVTVPEDAKYTAELAWYIWDDVNEEFAEFSDTTFVDGNIYSVDILVTPDAGYAFDSEMTAIDFDGSDYMINIQHEFVYIGMIYYFGIENVVDKIELTGVQLPKIGENATVEGLQTVEGANYFLEGAYWMESESGDIMNGGWTEAETFREGMYYALVAAVTPADGYVMGWSVPVYINGEEIQGEIREGMLNYDLSVFLFGPLEDESAAVTGDFTGDGVVNNEDVVYLLWHTLFEEDFPLTSNGDFTDDGVVNNEDVVYMLWYTLFPEDFPLE